MGNEFQEMLEEMKKLKAGQGKKFWSPPSDKEGTFPIRFLPPVRKLGEKVFYFAHNVHWLSGKPYECIKQNLVDKTGNLHTAEDCPICNLQRKLYDPDNKESENSKLSYEIMARPRYIFRVVVRGKDGETKPEFYESGKKLYETLFYILTESDFGNITDLKEGRDFNLVKKGVGRRSNYDTSTAAANVTMVFKTKEQIQELITNMENMPYNALIEFTSVDEMKRVLKAFISGDASDEDTFSKEVETYVEKAVKEPASERHIETKKKDDDADDIDDLLKEFDT